MSSPVDEMLESPDISVKLKKYTFSKDARLLLLKAVREFDAHLPGYGEKGKKFSKVYERFTENLSPKLLLRQQKPSLKTLRDKFRTMLSARKQQNAKNAAASGICEIVTEEEQLLDDFLLEIREEKSEREMKKKNSSQAEERLVNAGEKIQSMALERATLKKLVLPSTAKNTYALRR